MNIECITNNGIVIASVYNEVPVIQDVPSALDLMMSVKYETGSKNLVINKESFVDSFFILSSCMAGEILQKFVNYGVRMAIYGDFSGYTSKPLQDFMRESNHGKTVYFQPDKSSAIQKLTDMSKVKVRNSLER